MSVPYTKLIFKEAAGYILHFGKYKGQAIDKVGESDSGLLYLDWMRGSLKMDFHTKNAVNSYLDDPTIAKDLEQLISARRYK